jgi:serine/threonine protein phosphatase PrpC
VSDDLIGEILGRGDDQNIEPRCQMLIDAANAAGGPDNTTVVLLEACGATYRSVCSPT